MKNLLNNSTIQPRLSSCKCSLCGEELTAPIAYKGAFFGYSCIKKVNPTYKKSKDPVYWVEAISFTSETIINESGNPFTTIKAQYQGNRDKVKTFVDYATFYPNKAIIIQDNKAFINLYAFKNGDLYI